MYTFVISPPIGCEELLAAWQYVSFFVCLSDSFRSHISKTTHLNFTKFSVHVACDVARSFSDGNVIRYVLPVLLIKSFLYNGPKRPQSKTTRMFCPVSPGDGTGAKSAVSFFTFPYGTKYCNPCLYVCMPVRLSARICQQELSKRWDGRPGRITMIIQRTQ